MRSRYTWDHLFGNKVFTLYRGKDYDCSQSAMVAQVRNAASQRALRVNIHDGDSYIEVTVHNSVEPEILESLF